MKRYSILLLFSFLFTNATIVGILDLIPFILHKISIKEIILSSSDNLESHTFHQSTFEKYRIDKEEFRLNGDMYDIVSSRIVGDSIYVIAYRDLKETLILKGIEEHSKNEDSTMLIKKLISLVFDLPDDVAFPKVIFAKLAVQKHYFSLVLKATFTTNLLRPPTRFSFL